MNKYDKVNSVEEAYLQTMMFLARAFPHLYFLSKYLQIIYDEDMDYIAKTDGRTIYLTLNWITFPYNIRLAIFMHELYHVMLKHPLRMRQINVHKLIANIACDAKVNYLLLKSLETKLSDITTYMQLLPTYGVPEDLLERASVEEIIEWLINNSTSPLKPTFGDDIEEANFDSSFDSDTEINSENKHCKKSQKESQKTSQSQTVLNEGKSDLVKSSADEFEEKLNKIIRNSLISGKIAGSKLSAIEERILDGLTKSKVNWRSLLRNCINSYIKKNIASTFKRPNRRFSYLPGYASFSKPNAWVFVDLSGSIYHDEFKQFITEVYNLSKFVNDIHVIGWDTEVTGEYNLKGRDKQTVLSLKFRGGGGTRFAPVISNYIEKVKTEDVLICLTDGYWFDLKDSIKLLRKIRATKILVTTNREVDGFDKVIKIDN